MTILIQISKIWGRGKLENLDLLSALDPVHTEKMLRHGNGQYSNGQGQA